MKKDAFEQELKLLDIVTPLPILEALTHKRIHTKVGREDLKNLSQSIVYSTEPPLSDS